MRKRHFRALAATAAVLSLVAAACGSDDSDDSSDDTTAAECASVDDVSLQLQWVTQAQFAGYYAAVEEGFYDRFCLDVDIIEGGVEIVPQTQLANGDVDFALAWVPKALASREAGANIVNIGQIFQRSGTLQVSFVDAGITTPADFAGRKIGNWGFGNEYEVFAAMAEAQLDPATDVDNVAQQFDMNALLDGDIDAAEAMTYNEYAQVLEATNPETGELYQPSDLNVISYEDVGVGMLQDSIWANGDRLADDPEYVDIATRFVAASSLGWAFCRDNPEACRDIVIGEGSTLGASHQLWQMNEVNKLIWPSENGIGYIDQAAWDQTVAISMETPNLEGATVLTAPPSPDAFTNDIVDAAHELLGGIDLTGSGFQPIEVTLEPGGD
jgi:NitT/TauT family transport system substrate-binding protein